MTTNKNKRSRSDDIAALQKLSEGLTQHASTVPPIVIAGVTYKPSDVTAKLQTAIAQAKAVLTTEAAWHNAVQTEDAAWKQLKPFLLAVQQILRNAYDGQLDTLADFGVTPRKKPVVSPATRTAAALKAKATRAARGTKGSVQRASIKTDVKVAPAAVTSVTVDGTAPTEPAHPATAPTATPVEPSPAPSPATGGGSPSPSPSPNAGSTPATPASPGAPLAHS
jgi:hypothetical protein